MAKKVEVEVFPAKPGPAQDARKVQRWELEELWSVAAELCGDADPHQVLWSALCHEQEDGTTAVRDALAAERKRIEERARASERAHLTLIPGGRR